MSVIAPAFGIQRISLDIEVPFMCRQEFDHPPNIFEDNTEIRVKVAVVDGLGQKHSIGGSHILMPNDFRSRFGQIMDLLTREIEQFVAEGRLGPERPAFPPNRLGSE